MRRQLAGGLLAMSLAVTLALAGCGGTEDGEGVATAGNGAGAQPSASTSASAEAVSDADRQLEFARCMRENGVDMPDPEPGKGRGQMFRFGENADPEKVKAAMEQCRQYLPNGGEGVDLNPEQAEKLRELAKCMRENGVPNFPDPDADGRVRLDPERLQMSRDDPKLKAAMEKCRQYAPGLGGGNR